MDLLTYVVKYFKENDVIQHNSLQEEIDFLTQKVNEIKNKQHEVNSYIRYTKSEIDFSKITDKNYIDSIQIYSHDSQYNKNANRHSVVFMK